MLLLSSLLIGCGEKEPVAVPPVPPPTPAPPTPPAQLTHTTKSMEKDAGSCETLCAKVSAEWVVFDGPGAAPLNAWVTSGISATMFTGEAHASPEAMADEFLAQWKATLGESYAMSWDLTRTATVGWESDALVTLSLSEMSYTGGAHGSYGTTTAVFDRKSGEQVKLTDILKEGYEVALQPHIVAALEAQFEADLDEVGIERDDAGHIAVAGAWLVDAERLHLIYNPYEIGPYVIGAPVAEIPRADIAGLIKPDSPW